MRVVDAHLHVFADEQEGLVAQGGERLAGHAGVIEEVRGIVDRGRIDCVAIFSTLPVELWRRFLGPSWPAAEVEDRLLTRAIAQNTWLCETAATDDRFLAVVGADATLPSAAFVEHLDDHVRRYDVRALKIHPALNFAPPDHPGYAAVYSFAQEAGLPVITHGGSAAPMYAAEVDYCAPGNFGVVARDYPALRLVIAHLGAPYLADLVRMAPAFPNVHTDLSYVLGDPALVPSDQMVEVIRAFGVERVLFGADFPYFDPEASLDRLLTLDLGDEELELVAGANADRLFSR